MTATLTIAVATFTSSATLNNTDANVANIIMYALEDKVAPPPAGFTTAQKQQYWLDAFRDEIIRYTKQEAFKNHRRDLQAASNVDATAATDTTL